MIRFTCPSCKTLLQAKPEQAGHKIHCGVCGQRLLIPTPPQKVNKTVLGTLEQEPAPSQSLAPPPLPQYQPQPQYAPQQPYPPMQRHPAYYDDVEPHRGVMVLIFGILAWITLPFIFGPMAWSFGGTDLKKMDNGEMDESGRSMTQAGYYLGMAASYIVLGLIGVFALMIIGLLIIGIMGAIAQAVS